jgi:hypothetical protein
VLNLYRHKVSSIRFLLDSNFILGTNPQKNFSVISSYGGSSKKGFVSNLDSKSTSYSNKTIKATSSPGNELKKQFDAGVKGNIFHLNGHKIQWPHTSPSSSG